MKRILLFTAPIFCFFLAQAQQNIPIPNGNIEDATAMTQTTVGSYSPPPVVSGIWSITSFKVKENKENYFDVVNSGLASGAGVGGTQAFKLTTTAAGTPAGATLLSNPIDISAYGLGTYKFKFYAKSLNSVATNAFWIQVRNGNDNAVGITSVDNGGTQINLNLNTDFREQSVSVTVTDLAVTQLILQVQSGKFANSYWFDNFSLTFTPSALPVRLGKFTAETDGNRSKLNWNTLSEENNDYFMLERSADGENYAQLAKVEAKGQAATYSFIDQNPLNGANYYRLSQVDKDAKSTELGTKAVTFKLSNDIAVNVYPNPVESEINLSLQNYQGAFSVALNTVDGQILHQETRKATAGQSIYQIQLKAKPAPGTYILNIQGEKGLAKSIKVIVP